MVATRTRPVLIASLGLVGLYLAVAAAACALQRSVMFPAPPPRAVDAEGGSLLRVPGPHGESVYALHFPAGSAAPTVVYFHGNGEQLADVVPLAVTLHERGLGVLAVEYPGYGLAAAGQASEQALYGAAERALEYARATLGIDVAHTVLVGQSLGTGVAVEMAHRGHASRLVLLSPYTSMSAMGSHVAPFLPMSLLIRDRFDSGRKAPAIAIPVLIVHGTEDEVIPVTMGQALAQSFPHATLVLVPGGHHNDLWASPAARLVERIARFAEGS